MTEYRRNRLAGGSYFFTVSLRDRRSDLLVIEIEALRSGVRATRARTPFYIDGWVVLPDHMHCIWALPPDDADYSTRWRSIKAGFSRSVHHPAPTRASLIRKREAGLWQRRFWEHTFRDERDYRTLMDYIHFNPVKHGLAATPGAWPYSTFARCVAEGLYPRDWVGNTDNLVSAGERG